MNRMLQRALISVAVAIAVYIIGINVVWGSDDNLLYIAAVLAGGCCWIGSRE